MNRLYSFLASFFVLSLASFAQVTTERCFHLDKVQFLQHRQDFWKSHMLYSTASRPLSMYAGGYFNLTEGNYGFGLGETSTPYSHHFAGLTNVNGWRFNWGMALGLGVGYQQYNDGWLLPVYGDARYFFGKQKNKIFAMLDGGMLFSFENFEENSRYFLNPGAGITVSLARSLNLSFAAGLYTQYDIDFWKRDVMVRDTFVNMKLGLMFGR